MAQQLLSDGHLVHGLVRLGGEAGERQLRSWLGEAGVDTRRLLLHRGDIEDATTLRRLIVRSEPDTIFHFAGQSHVGASFEIPERTCRSIADATLGLLEILRDLSRPPKLLHASSGEIFGDAGERPSHEESPMRPRNPYGVAKAFATQMVRVYRESFGLLAWNAICFNHESPRRPAGFVTRKLCDGAVAIAAGRQQRLRLGRLDPRRDWGYAPEYVDAMRRMLDLDRPDDFVLATGTSHSVQDFAAAAFAAVGLDWRDHIDADASNDRPADPGRSTGDPAKAARILGWEAQTRMPELAQIMVASSDVVQAGGRHIPGGGVSHRYPP